MTDFIKITQLVLLFFSFSLTGACWANDAPDDVPRKAQAGDSEAQYRLGLRYDRGSDTQPRDAEKALFWYNNASDNGNLKAKSILGRIYEFGCFSLLLHTFHHNITQDICKAILYYKECAKSDSYYWEQQHLADLFYEGEKVEKDYAEAVIYYKRYIDNPMVGHRKKGKAMNRLSICYRYGRGVDIDVDTSDYWRSKAAESGYIEAMEVSGKGIYGTVYFEDGTPFTPLDNEFLQLATVHRKCDEGNQTINVLPILFKKEDNGFFTLPDEYRDEILVMKVGESFHPIEFKGTQNLRLTLIKKQQ